MACTKALVRHKPKEEHQFQKRSSLRARMPVKCTLDGTYITDSRLGTYQANSISDGIRKCREDIDRRVKPFSQAVIAGLRLITLWDVSSQNSSNAAGRIAFLELCGEWVPQKVLLCPLSIRFQGIVKN